MGWWLGPVHHLCSTYQTTWPDHTRNEGNQRDEHMCLHRQTPRQSSQIDALIVSVRSSNGNYAQLQDEKLPRGMFWNLDLIRSDSGDTLVELYCSAPEPPSSRSQWHVLEEVSQ